MAPITIFYELHLKKLFTIFNDRNYHAIPKPRLVKKYAPCTASEILNPMGGISGIKERDRPAEQSWYQKTRVVPSN